LENKYLFKIRSNDDFDSEKLSNQKEEKYKFHLQKNNINRNVLKYFGCDFFHDGLINNIINNISENKLYINMNCPNIYDKKTKKYFNLKYNLEFINVAIFNIFTTKYSKYNDPLNYGAKMCEYLYSEINSLNKEIDYFNFKYPKMKFTSLIIQCFPSIRYIHLVFEKIKVYPENKTQFEKYKKNKYYFPYFRGLSE
jgi:hypothetical protein